MTNTKPKQLLINLSEEMMAEIIRLKKETGLSMNAIVRLAIRDYLNKK